MSYVYRVYIYNVHTSIQRYLTCSATANKLYFFEKRSDILVLYIGTRRTAWDQHSWEDVSSWRICLHSCAYLRQISWVGSLNLIFLHIKYSTYFARSFFFISFNFNMYLRLLYQTSLSWFSDLVVERQIVRLVRFEPVPPMSASQVACSSQSSGDLIPRIFANWYLEPRETSHLPSRKFADKVFLFLL